MPRKSSNEIRFELQQTILRSNELRSQIIQLEMMLTQAKEELGSLSGAFGFSKIQKLQKELEGAQRYEDDLNLPCVTFVKPSSHDWVIDKITPEFIYARILGDETPARISKDSKDLDLEATLNAYESWRKGIERS